MERRIHNKPVEVREQEDGKRSIHGYAAVYYREGDTSTEYEIMPGYNERIMPGAFDRAIREDDVRALFDHDSSKVLGRTKSGTLRLVSDDVGLRYEVDLPDTTAGTDTHKSISRGDIDGSSFAFIVRSKEMRRENGVDIREVTDVQLFDVGPVTYPAYEATSVDARSAKKELEQAVAEREQRQKEKDAARARLRLLELEGVE